MAFQFPLQAVLHLRQSVEHHQELRLRAANQQVARVQHLIEQMEMHGKKRHSLESEALSSGTTAAELQFGLLCGAAMTRHRCDLELQLTRMQQLRDQQRELFRQARRARETLESVRENRLRLYKKEALRRDQRNLDDLFLMRREFQRRG